MAATRGGFPKLLVPGLAAVFFRKYTAIEQEHTAWCPVKSSSRAFEDEAKVIGLGQMTPKAEGTVVTFDDPQEGGEVRYTHITYSLGVRITQEMMEDDLYGIMTRMMAELSQSAAYQWDTIATSILNNAFSGSFLGFDGKALCATDHPLTGTSSVQANRPGTDVDLSLAAIQAGVEAFENTVTDRNMVSDATPKHLLHGTTDIFTAGEILESEFKPGGNDNDRNILRSRYGIGQKLVKRKSDADSWFLVGNKGDVDYKMYRRRSTQTRESTDPFNGDKIMTVTLRGSAGFGDYRNIYGSSGA